MNLLDYLIDQEGKDWEGMLQDGGFLLPASFTIWLVNRIGDIFAVLDDESVHMLDAGAGTFSRVADDRDDFAARIDLEDKANEWLLVDLVDACVEAGLSLKSNQCYSYKIPPILGGSYTVDNIHTCDLSVHYSFLADICRQAKDLPDGARVEIVGKQR